MNKKTEWISRMNPLESIIEFDKFLDIFLSQISPSEIDKSYAAVIKVTLYYIWRGTCMAWLELLSPKKLEKNLAALCIATYKSFLPVIQNIRLGYQSDVLILARSLLERIALMGYLNANPLLIPRYIYNNENFNNEALKWAKSRVPDHIFPFYSLLSDIAHVKKSGSAFYLFDNRTDGLAIQNVFSNQIDTQFTDQLFGLVWNEIYVANIFFLEICGFSAEDSFEIDKLIFKYISIEDFNEFRKFLTEFTNKS